jgi:small conductance mechanosensitive channel
MIAEQWYNVGDHIKIDPFWELSGVVEKVNLRSTKLRTLSGEEVWVHNQHIQAVRVTPRGVRTMSVDTFVSDLEKGRKLIGRVINTMPTGPAMIATALVIKDEEQHGGVWRITAVGQTTPGREWLIEDFAVRALKEADEANKEQIIVHGPIVRYSDALAEKRFLHSMSA